ncbi:uncharacterized protein LOC110465285, partial [Mizuhopecten yessoensis]|uniref:uncharacterized protein LOC110465285 n=1 Tax=Mizuhopecten yessoensis TaxID=6573 RepID=UPI000B458FEB
TSDNSGTGNTGSGQNAIEEFYADKHNMAMFLILPLIILVYGGCAGIYCFYKFRRYLKKRIVVYKKEKRIKILKRKNCIESSSFHNTGWTAATNEVQFGKSMPNLRENKTDVCKRPSTALAACASIETQEVDQLLEELAIITEDKPVTKAKKPTAEVTPVVQVRPPVQRVQSKIIDKPKVSKSPPVVVEVKSIVDDDKINNNEDTSQSDAKIKRKSLILSASDIAEIMKYYNNKKHMPNVIPEDSENDKEICRRVRKKKIFST